MQELFKNLKILSQLNIHFPPRFVLICVKAFCRVLLNTNYLEAFALLSRKL
jgi:hypothetical protein